MEGGQVKVRERSSPFCAFCQIPSGWRTSALWAVTSLSDETSERSFESAPGFESASFGATPTCFCGFLGWTSTNTSGINAVYHVTTAVCISPLSVCSHLMYEFRMNSRPDAIGIHVILGGGGGRFYSPLVRLFMGGCLFGGLLHARYWEALKIRGE